MTKENSLGHLEAWLNDALHSDATSKDVYDSIVNTIKDEFEYHKRCLKRSQDLLVMVKGNISALYDTETDVDKISLNDSQAYVSSKVTEAKSEKEFRDFFRPSMDNFSTPEEGEEWVKDNGGYEYTPPKPFVPITDYPDIPHRY